MYILHTSLGRRPAGPGNFLGVGVLLTDGFLEWLLFTMGVEAWWPCGVFKPAYPFCLEITGVVEASAPLRLPWKVLAEYLSVWLHKEELVLPMGKGQFPVWPFVADEHLKAPLCCQTGLADFISLAFELLKDLKPVEKLGLLSTWSSFSDRKFDVELYGVETLFKGSSLLLVSSESPGLKLHFENSCNCESPFDRFLWNEDELHG